MSYPLLGTEPPSLVLFPLPFFLERAEGTPYSLHPARHGHAKTERLPETRPQGLRSFSRRKSLNPSAGFAVQRLMIEQPYTTCHGKSDPMPVGRHAHHFFGPIKLRPVLMGLNG